MPQEDNSNTLLHLTKNTWPVQVFLYAIFNETLMEGFVMVR